MASMPYSFLFFSGPTTLEDAAEELSQRGMHVVKQSDGFAVQWAPGSRPIIDVGLNAEEWVVTEAIGIAEDKDLPALANLDRRFEIPFADFDDLEEVLNDYNTLFEVETILQELTGGYIYMTWNGNVIAPESAGSEPRADT